MFPPSGEGGVTELSSGKVDVGSYFKSAQAPILTKAHSAHAGAVGAVSPNANLNIGVCVEIK